jgi:signal transduction histidine kinase
MKHIAESPLLLESPVPAAGADDLGPPDGPRDLTAALAGRDSFIGRLGHELRNVVAPMLLIAEQLQAMAAEPDAPPLLASRTSVLTRNLGKLVATVDRVAEISALRRGAIELELDSVDLVEVVAGVCRQRQREAAAGGATLVFDAGEPVPGLWDRVRLEQIVENLVSNAIRYGGGGPVELAVVDRGTAGELIVRDHGPGLAPAVLAHLFEAFAPQDLEPNRRTGGFGIGLWVVKTLCTAMQGSVTAENDPGGGARFCVVLPRG